MEPDGVNRVPTGTSADALVQGYSILCGPETSTSSKYAVLRVSPVIWPRTLGISHIPDSDFILEADSVPATSLEFYTTRSIVVGTQLGSVQSQ